MNRYEEGSQIIFNAGNVMRSGIISEVEPSGMWIALENESEHEYFYAFCEIEIVA